MDAVVIKRLGLLVFLLTASSALLADHPGKIETSLADGGLVISKSFKTNLVIYSSVGGGTDVKGKEQKRKWWCLWLCKVRVDKNAERIAIMNTYYSEVSPGVFVAKPEEPVICTNASSCEQKAWAFGVGVKIEFPGGGPSPTPLPGLLPVDGVITAHEILVDGRPISVVTSAGKHPTGSGPVFE